MNRQDQVGLLKRLLHYVDTRTTSMADAPWRNDVSVYTDAERLTREQQILFRQHPIVVGFASEWAAPGSFRADDYAGVPVLVVRGRDGKLRAFLNVCRHRGAKVAQGCGKARAFSCPYHAWTYDLSGKVMGIPDERSFPGVRAERGELTSFAFGTWAFYDKRVIPETMNWKLLVDTFHEGYHIGFLHKDSLSSILH